MNLIEAISKFVSYRSNRDSIYLIRDSHNEWYLKFNQDGSYKYYYDCKPHTMRTLNVEDICATDWRLKK